MRRNRYVQATAPEILLRGRCLISWRSSDPPAEQRCKPILSPLFVTVHDLLKFTTAFTQIQVFRKYYLLLR